MVAAQTSLTRPPVLSVRNLRLEIAGRRLCSNLSFEVHQGESWGILGRNGAGKTTLLHALAGLREPAQGSIELGGRELRHYSLREIALARGLLEQSNFDAFSSTALEVALAGRHPYLPRWGWESSVDEAAAWSALVAVGLETCAERDALTLSGGERRRLALATLLAQDPPLLLLDEPTASLDLHHQVAVLKLLQDLRQKGRTVVMVLHDLTLAARYCDHVLLLDGEATKTGLAAELLSADHLAECFHHPIRVLADGDGRAFVPG